MTAIVEPEGVEIHVMVGFPRSFIIVSQLRWEIVEAEALGPKEAERGSIWGLRTRVYLLQCRRPRENFNALHCSSAGEHSGQKQMKRRDRQPIIAFSGLL